mgnify:CR=1 FL=1
MATLIERVFSGADEMYGMAEKALADNGDLRQQRNGNICKALNDVGIVAHHRQGRFQFVGHIGNKVRTQCFRAGKLLGHIVDTVNDPVEAGLIRDALHRLNSNREVSLHDFCGSSLFPSVIFFIRRATDPGASPSE